MFALLQLPTRVQARIPPECLTGTVPVDCPETWMLAVMALGGAMLGAVLAVVLRPGQPRRVTDSAPPGAAGVPTNGGVNGASLAPADVALLARMVDHIGHDCAAAGCFGPDDRDVAREALRRIAGTPPRSKH